MINPDIHLDTDIFGKSPKKAAVRSGYGEGLVAAGETDRNVVVLTADLSESTRVEEFSKRFPERFFDVGVAEQGMATTAAGLGISGKIPFISSYAVFSPGRNWEQIRTTIAYNDSNVKIAGHHAGISTGPDGATHQAIEDIATMRAMPNMKVIVPCDAMEAKKATMAVAKVWGPCYLRLSREKTAVMTTEDTPFVPGKAELFWDTSFGTKRGKKPQVAIISCGPIIYEALKAAKTLEKEGIGSMVLNCHTVKPIDRKAVVAAAKRCGAVVVVEEHNIIGGLGGAVAEVLAMECPTRVAFIGMKDEFAESGRPEELIEKYGLGESAIVSASRRITGEK